MFGADNRRVRAYREYQLRIFFSGYIAGQFIGTVAYSISQVSSRQKIQPKPAFVSGAFLGLCFAIGSVIRQS